jgi:hypothetical protein
VWPGRRISQAVKGIEEGSNSGDGFCFQGEGREVRDDPGDGVPPVSDRERGRRIPVRDLTRWAVGQKSGWDGTFPRVHFHIFLSLLLFFFCFLISLITFANLVQIASNQLCKVSKIQNHIPEQ